MGLYFQVRTDFHPHSDGGLITKSAIDGEINS